MSSPEANSCIASLAKHTSFAQTVLNRPTDSSGPGVPMNTTMTRRRLVRQPTAVARCRAAAPGEAAHL